MGHDAYNSRISGWCVSSACMSPQPDRQVALKRLSSLSHARIAPLPISTTLARSQAAFTEHFADEANKGDDVAEALRPLLESELDFKSFVLFDCIAQRSREGPACVELGLLARVIEEMYDKAKRTPSESRYRRVAIGDEADMRAIADVLDLELPLDARRAFLNMRMLWYWSESPAREREIHEVGKMCRLRNALRPYVWTIKRIASVGLDAPGCGARFKREHGRFTRALQTRM